MNLRKKYLILPLTLVLLVGWLLIAPRLSAQNRDTKGDNSRDKAHKNGREGKFFKRQMDELRKQMAQARQSKDEKKVQEVQRKMRQLKRRMEMRKWRRSVKGKGRGLQGILAKPNQPNLRDIAHFSLAQIYLNQNRQEQAILELKKVSQKSPNLDTRSADQYSIGNIHLSKGNPAKAIEYYLKVQGRFRHRARLRSMTLLRKARNPEQVEKAFQKVIGSSQNVDEEAMARLVLANYYRKRKMISRAIDQLRKITIIDYRKFRKNRKGHRKGPHKRGDKTNPPSDQRPSANERRPGRVNRPFKGPRRRAQD